MGKHSSHRGDLWAHLIADVLMRIGWFAGAFVLAMASVPRGYYRDWDREGFPEYLYGLLAAATLAAVFGPWLYRKATQHGRGTLGQVKRDSVRMRDEG